MQKILVVVAHPDDEILGMGGTIAKLSAEGKDVHVIIVTDGSSALPVATMFTFLSM